MTTQDGPEYDYIIVSQSASIVWLLVLVVSSERCYDVMRSSLSVSRELVTFDLAIRNDETAAISAQYEGP